jgi:hypothetical protein
MTDFDIRKLFSQISDPADVAEQDQQAAAAEWRRKMLPPAIKEYSKTAYLFYEALRDAGFSVHQALQMTIEMQTAIVKTLPSLWRTMTTELPPEEPE